ncbi:MAG: putative sugar nucleotidyl transferase [Melioribacteraceae bacterium]|nr:putative sugar nucleotidyl transferase [Melioribacteraceae bacterium]
MRPEEKVNDFSAEKILFINSRILPDEELVKIFSANEVDEFFLNGEEIIAARLSGENISKFISENLVSDDISNFDCKKTEIDYRLLNYSWDLVSKNGEEIKNDILILSPKNIVEEIEGVHLVNKEKIFLGENVKIRPNVRVGCFRRSNFY